MTRIALITALVAGATALSAPAFAQSASTALAIEHFNQDYDSRDDRRLVPNGNSSVTVSTRSGGPLASVFAHFNQDFDSNSDLRGLVAATTYSNRPARNAEIFARIRQESLEDE